MFNKVMQNESICKRVIETLLGIKVGKLVYKENQKTMDYSYLNKGIKLDVYVEDSTVDLKDKMLKILYNVKEYGKITEVQKRSLLEYIATAKNSDLLTKDIDSVVEAARMNEPWRIEYMQYNEKMKMAKKDGVDESIALLIKSGKFDINDIAEALKVSLDYVKEIQRTME